jgi:hypothetical protein
LGSKAEQTISVALQTEPILTIACWTSASTQILLDLDLMQVLLDQPLLVAVRQDIDRQALVGVGPAAELKGISIDGHALQHGPNESGRFVYRRCKSCNHGY